MNGRFPKTISQEQVALFMEKYKPLANLGLFLIGVKTLQKIAPDLTEAILVSLATAIGSSNQKSTGRANKLPEDTHTEPMTLPKPQSASPTVDVQLVESQKWQRVISHPSVVVVVGRRGSGKSGLSYKLLEIFRYQLNPYVLGIPAQAQKLLPDWIGIARNLNEIPPFSIVLIDEAFLHYHSRDSLSTQSKEMSRLVNLSRQRNLTLVFVTPETRQIDKNIISQANVIIFKEPAMLQIKFDRKELNNIAEQAKLAFNDLSGDKRKWSYVYSEDTDFMGLVENSLPTFWSTELSHAFAISNPIMDGRLPKNPSKEEKIARAKELHQNRFSYRDIGKMLGINEGTAYNYVNDYPYRK